MQIIDNFLDKITMYRLVLYLLLLLAIYGFFLKLFVPYIFYFVSVIIVSWLTNKIFSKIFKVPTNLESVYISALILILVVDPSINIIWLAIVTQASKYLLAINKKHIFNPVAITLVIFGSASWWIVTIWTVPIILIGGLLITYKLRRFQMMIAFFIASLLAFYFSKISVYGFVAYSPLLFFAFIMLTEPQTSPTAKFMQIIYGTGIGIFYSLKGFSPEMALVIGNIFSYLVSSKEKLILTLKEKIQIAPNIYEFIFGSNKKLDFIPGQYLEWTIPSQKPDSRGNRRYMTIASSPTESDLHLATKYYEKPSTFKKILFDLDKPIVASQLAGDFTLPKDPNIKLAFVAGGIGITPFRSIIKYLIDTKQVRDIVLIYINKTADEIVYKEIFNNIKTIYINTSQVGHLNDKMVNAQIPDAHDRTWYISGPHNMVSATEKLLRSMSISHIKTDFFPGLV